MFLRILGSLLIKRDQSYSISLQQLRYYRDRYVRHQLRDLWGRRQLVGPEPLTPRSAKINWNYDAELFAFGPRLNERFQSDTLRRVFVHSSYANKENVAGPASETSKDNSEFVAEGRKIISDYTKAFLRYHYEKLPEEAICAVATHLTTDAKLADLAKHIGTSDLILSADFPILETTLSDSFAAVVGALKRDVGLDRAELFVRDFVLTQLVNIDINEIFNPANPMEILKAVLLHQKRAPPEPRIMRQAGSITIVPVYVVGIYSNKELLGHSPGESLSIATDMASRESLKHLWCTSRDARSPYKFKEDLNLNDFKNSVNFKLSEILPDDQQLILADSVEKDPLDIEQMAVMYRDKIEKRLGTPLTRRLKHRFHYGTFLRRAKGSFIKPKTDTI